MSIMIVEKILTHNLYEAFRDKIMRCHDIIDVGRLYNLTVQIFDLYGSDANCSFIRDKLLAISSFVTTDLFISSAYNLSEKIFIAVSHNEDLCCDLELFLECDIKLLREAGETRMIS
jgi:hypothetical protein